MKVKPDQITRAIRIAKAISAKIDPAFARVNMGTDEDNPLEKRLSLLDDIRPVKPYTPDQHFASGGMARGAYALGGADMYSHAADVAGGHPQEQIPADDLRKYMQSRDVSPEEMEWSGFNKNYPSGSTVNRADAQEMFSGNIPNVLETEYGGYGNTEFDKARSNMERIRDEYYNAQNEFWQLYDQYEPRPDSSDIDVRRHRALLERAESRRDALEHEYNQAVSDLGDVTDHDNPEPKWGAYTVPGGKNYKETVLHLPSDSPHIKGAEGYEEEFGEPMGYKHEGHWEGIDNPIGHIRTKHRETIDGEPFLNIEEVQSDWGQEGRKSGFYDPKAEENFNNFSDQTRKDAISKLEQKYIDRGEAPDMAKFLASDVAGAWSVKQAADYIDHDNTASFNPGGERNAQLKKLSDQYRASTPAAPWVTDEKAWTDLAARRMFQDARKHGHGMIGISPPEEISKINSHGTPLAIAAWQKEGQDEKGNPYGSLVTRRWDTEAIHSNDSKVRPSELKSMIGDEAAAKMIEKINGDTPYAFVDSSEVIQPMFGGGRKHAKMMNYYGSTLPKRMLKLAREFDPNAYIDTVSARTEPHKVKQGSMYGNPVHQVVDSRGSVVGSYDTPEEAQIAAHHASHRDFKVVRFDPKLIPSRMRAYADGGSVQDDSDHPLTQDVYHGIQGEGVGPDIGQAIGQQMFMGRHPRNVNFQPNATALMLGPHVSRDPYIAGDFRFTTGEQMIHGDEGLRRYPDKPRGQVKMLRTFPDEKFFPVSQPSTQKDEFEEHGVVAPHDYDDRAVHRLVMSTVLSQHPDLAKRVLTQAYGGTDPTFDPDEMIQYGIGGLTPEKIDKFFRYNSVNIEKPLRQEIINRFRKIMRDNGYVGLSYINTDEDETRKASDAPAYRTRPAADKKCYIVFPQRDKETGWQPLRDRYANFDPARKAKPALHEAHGGFVDGYADGGMPENTMAAAAESENAPGVTVSPRPGKMGGYPVRMGTMDEHEPWSFTTPEGEEAPSPPPIQHPVFTNPRLDRLHKATAPIFKSKGFNDLVEDLTGLRGLSIKPIVGTWKGEAEPSFHISHPDMTAEHVKKLAPLLGFGFQQDAVVHHHHNPDPENEGFPTAYIGKNGRMSKSDLDKVIEASKREGVDFSQTSDGRGVKFSHFGDDDEEFKEFGNAVGRIADAVKFPHRHYVRSSGDLQNAQDYLTGIFGEGEGAHGESGLHGGTTRSPDLFGRIVDHVLAPYAKAVSSEGYRLSPQRLAETYGLSPEETNKVRSALLPKGGDRTTVPLMEGKEQLDIQPTGHGGKPTVGDVLFALQNRATQKGQVDPGDYSDEASNKIASDISKEVKYHVDHAGKSAIGWYDSALKKAMDQYHNVFPELKSDKDRQTMFKAILGITSQGQDVFANSSHTAKLYSLVRDGATLPEAVDKLKGTFGDKTAAIEFNLNKLHQLATNVGGYSNLHDILNKTKTVSQWNKILKDDPALNTGDKPLKMSGGKDQKVTGWMAFGPKIGSFINNLNGDFSTLTADLWFSRTWNRMLGHNFIHTPSAESKQYRDFRDALIAEHASHNPDNALAEASPHKTSNGVVQMDASGKPKEWLHGNDISDMDHDQFDALVNDPDKMLSYAGDLEKKYRMGQYKKKSDLRRRAKNWIENRELPVAAPRGDLERDFQQKTVERAQKQLKRQGLDISIADIQAALWFHEKDLFRRLGVASEKAAPADYADAATKTIKDLGLKPEIKGLKTGGAAVNRAILISMRANKRR